MLYLEQILWLAEDKAELNLTCYFFSSKPWFWSKWSPEMQILSLCLKEIFQLVLSVRD